jgi:hypothetical protein
MKLIFEYIQERYLATNGHSSGGCFCDMDTVQGVYSGKEINFQCVILY